MVMEVDTQVQKNPHPVITEFLLPDKPVSSKNLTKNENLKQTQGAKRGANEQEEPNDESNDELDFYSDTSSKSLKGKKQKSEKTHTSAQRFTSIEAINKKLTLELSQASNKIIGLEKKVEDLEKKILEIIEKSNSQPASSQSQASIDFWSKLPKQAAFEITQAVRQETALLDKKEKNVIVFGVPESVSEDESRKIQDDKRSIENVLTAINVKTQIGEFKFRRIRNKSQNQNNVGPIIIEFENSTQKLRVLKASKQLNRTGEHKNIYINPDRTTAEIEIEKKLRLERNQKNSELEFNGSNGMKFGKFSFSQGKQPEDFYWGIRNSKLQRIKIKTNNQLD